MPVFGFVFLDVLGFVGNTHQFCQLESGFVGIPGLEEHLYLKNLTGNFMIIAEIL